MIVVCAALTAIALSACGSSSSQKIAEVQGSSSPITKGLIEHWIRIESVLAYHTIPTEPVPSGVVPVPPDYSACIAFLGTKPFLGESHTKQTKAQLKARCVQRYKEIKNKVLNYMIAYRWVSGELARRGVKTTQAEVAKAINDFKIKNFEHPEEEFKKYMAYSGETPADLHFIIEYTLLGTKLQKLTILRKGLTAAQERQELTDFTKRWTAKTSCVPAYVVPGCKQYKGSETPPL
jgi:hypothetical protein